MMHDVFLAGGVAIVAADAAGSSRQLLRHVLPDGSLPVYSLGQAVEARDPATHVWRRAVLIDYAPYRGREGWYIQWADQPSFEQWESRGGWHSVATIRTVQS